MPEIYTVRPNDSLWSIARSHNVSFQELKNANPELRNRIPPYGVSPGDRINVPTPQPTGDVRQVCETCPNCVTYHLTRPFLIAIARDSTIVTRVNLTVNDDALNGRVIELGQDMQWRRDTPAPGGQSVGTDEATLATEMRGLLGQFASNDPSGKASRLIEQFLAHKDGPHPEVFTDADLDSAVAAHENFISFSNRTLAAPGTEGANPPRPRIHQALRAAGWNINNVRQLSGLGVPAFNIGSKWRGTGDFGNGLGLMINGVQYVFVFVEDYDYDSCRGTYVIRLKFVLYDVFGLDDDDLREYGSSGGMFSTAAGRGITAWWQLQHQFYYRPLLTRAIVYRTFTVPAR